MLISMEELICCIRRPVSCFVGDVLPGTPKSGVSYIDKRDKTVNNKVKDKEKSIRVSMGQPRSGPGRHIWHPMSVGPTWPDSVAPSTRPAGPNLPLTRLNRTPTAEKH